MFFRSLLSLIGPPRRQRLPIVLSVLIFSPELYENKNFIVFFLLSGGCIKSLQNRKSSGLSAYCLILISWLIPNRNVVPKTDRAQVTLQNLIEFHLNLGRQLKLQKKIN